MRSIAKVVIRLERRKRSFAKLLPAKRHKEVTLRVQQAYGALGATAQLLPEIVSAAQTYSAGLSKIAVRSENRATRQRQRANRMSRIAARSSNPAIKDWASAFERITVDMNAANRRLSSLQIHFSEVAVAGGLFSLFESVEALAASRDAEALKHLGWRVAEGAVKWGTKLLPIRYDDVKEVLEAIGGLKDLADAGSALKLRRQQARAGADFLNWIDAINLLILSWNAEAQRFLLATKGKSTTDDQVLELAMRRSVACSQEGWPDG